MSGKIVITIEGPPVPWRAPFVGSRGAYSPRYNEMQLFKSIIRSQYKGPLIEVAVIVDLIFYMRIPKSASKKKQAMMLSGLLRPEGPPDRTNLAKLYEDCLQEIVIGKDSRIVDGRIAKFYDENPRAEIYIEPI